MLECNNIINVQVITYSAVLFLCQKAIFPNVNSMSLSLRFVFHFSV